MVAAETKSAVRLKIAVCDSNAPIVTIDKGNDGTHRAILQTGQAYRLPPPQVAGQLATFDPVEDGGLVEEGTDHPDAYFSTHRHSVEDTTMTLTTELEELIRCYLLGTRTMEDVREWLLDHVQAVLDSTDPRLEELDGESWLLISEYDRGDRSEASIREALAQFVPTDSPLQPVVTPGQGRASGDRSL